MRRSKGFTLVEIMIVVAIIGILIAVAVPSFLRAREISRRNSCQSNLSQIDAAKQRWALETSASFTATPTFGDLVGATSYMRSTPSCPGNGTYTIGDINTLPSCNYSSTNPDFLHTFPGESAAGS